MHLYFIEQHASFVLRYYGPYFWLLPRKATQDHRLLLLN